MSLFTTATSLSALLAGFERVRANRGGPGGDGMTIERFAVALEARLASLHWAIQHGYYVAGPLRRVTIPKTNGGMRTLAIPCVTDRIAQTAVATALGERLEPEFEDDSFAYRKGRSVAQAVARVAYLHTNGYPYVVDGDIRAFFDEVPHAPLLARLERSVDDTALIDLVGHWLEGFGAGGRGLAQGSPLSPLLANLYLDDLDEIFAGGPVRIVRFADDFILLTRSHKSAEAALARARDYLAAHGLVLHPDKTRIVPFEGAFDFLGHLFVRSVVIARNAPAPATLGPRSIFSPATAPDPALAIDDEVARAVLVDPAPAPNPPRPAKPAAAPAVTIDDVVADLARDRTPEDFAIGLAPLYVLGAGRRLDTANDCFTVSEGSAEQLRIPARMVGRIEIGPEAVAESAALRMAADHGIPLSYVNGLGAAQAVLMPALSDHAGLHLAQARMVLEPTRALAMARVVVEGRLRNQHALLKRLNRRRRRDDVAVACETIKALWPKARHAANLDIARGYEGDGAKHYWAALGASLEHGFALPRRRGDSANPVTAVLNFTASLLTRDMVAAILRAGLHPGFGVLHSGGDYRDACGYDLVEAFRAPLAEGLTVYLFNNRVMQIDDFSDSSGATRLTGAAARRLVESYERWLARPVKNPRTGTFTTWRGLLLADARGLATALRDDGAFKPYALDH